MNTLVMPKLGLTMKNGVLSQWFKEEGEEIKQGQPIMEIRTNKIAYEVEAPADGILLKILVPVGEEADVGTVLGYLGNEEEKAQVENEIGLEQVPANKNMAVDNPEEKETPTQKSSVPTRDKRVVASPLAKTLAQELGLDLTSIEGTGPGGRITQKDVENAAQVRNQDS